MAQPTQPNYCIQARNATAVNILRSWLNAVGIASSPSKAPGFDLAVVRADGSLVEVQVTLRAGEALPGPGVQVLAHEVTGKKAARALAAFHQITDAAGYARAQPVDRGAEPELNEQGNPRKLHYRDEDFLVAIRHTEFRRAPNPPADRWKQYRPTMEKTSWAFLRNNYELCTRHGLGIDDLLSHARCWTVNFCARYETPTPKYFDNERKLYAYLQQRFAHDLRTILQKKERSVLPDAETVSLALYGRPHLETEVNPYAIDAEANEAIDDAYVARNCELDTSSPAARRESAAKMLHELLGQLPHERLVEVLKETAQNTHFDITTRKEASRRLKEHAAGCSEGCVVEVAAPAEPQGKALLDGRTLPQADLFSTLRCLAEHLGDGVNDQRELSNSLRISDRQISYYRHAGQLLELFNAAGLTERGERLLETDSGTMEEADVFHDAIRSTPALAVFEWFFDQGATKEELMTFILGNFQIAESTAQRRADCLLRWRKTLVSRHVGVQEDEDLAGGDALSVQE